MYGWVMSHKWVRQVTPINKSGDTYELCHAEHVYAHSKIKWVLSVTSMNESCHINECVKSYSYISPNTDVSFTTFLLQIPSSHTCVSSHLISHHTYIIEFVTHIFPQNTQMLTLTPQSPNPAPAILPLYTYVCLHLHICVNLFMYICMYGLYSFIHIHINKFTHMCMYTYVCIFYTYTYICTNIIISKAHAIMRNMIQSSWYKGDIEFVTHDL